MFYVRVHAFVVMREHKSAFLTQKQDTHVYERTSVKKVSVSSSVFAHYFCVLMFSRNERSWENRMININCKCFNIIVSRVLPSSSSSGELVILPSCN